MAKLRTDLFRVRAGKRALLSDISTTETGGLTKEEGRAEFEKLADEFYELQQVFYADGRYALLVVLQGMDCAGKDGTIRHVFSRINPEGCEVTSFKSPTELELRHDFLWRVHDCVPRTRHIAVFNRSHYEDILIVRVRKWRPESRLKHRFRHINEFERLLFNEGTHILKFYLHISKDYQKERLLARLKMPEKRWKFNPEDLVNRALWKEYVEVYEDALTRCNKPFAPWYIVPAEKKWFRDLLVLKVVVERLRAMKLRFPPPTFDPKAIVIE